MVIAMQTAIFIMSENHVFVIYKRNARKTSCNYLAKAEGIGYHVKNCHTGNGVFV
uniref:hypothetical protein n=1 Tax=Agathobacter sp. TaxID=2021311 RepID=UPI004056665E